MGETLFIAHRMPFPPDRGDKIRSHHLLKALAAIGPVHVAAFGETAADFGAEARLAEIARTHRLVRRQTGLVGSGLRALATGKPVSLTAFDSLELHRWIRTTLESHRIDTVFVFSGQMGQYVPASFDGRLVVDLCDVDSAKFAAYGERGAGLRAWIDAREGRLLADEEVRLAKRADATLLVSEAEAALFRARLGGSPANVIALGNGVDTRLFAPGAVESNRAVSAADGPQLVFTGQMDYAPNVAAVTRTTLRLMPTIRDEHPNARFHIVGRAPTQEVRALEGLNGTKVWGEVPDVRPFLAASNLVVAPLEIARGVQNKVLEAMAMARAVLVSPEAATGIGGTDDIHYAVGASDQALIERALDLLSSGAKALTMGASARKFVVEHKSWDAALAPLSSIMGRKIGACDAA